MDAPNTVESGTAACGASASLLCGVISVLADGELLFSRYPWVGFVTVSALGGFIGWCILLEKGAVSSSGLSMLPQLALRVSMGAGIGIMCSIIWYAFDGESKGLPMLVSALIAIFPLEAYRNGLKRFKLILKEAFK